MEKLFENIPLFAAAIAFACAQLLKPIINAMLGNGWKWRFLITTGGMPSSHSAAAAALTVSVGMSEGINSTAFAICVFIALVIMIAVSPFVYHIWVGDKVSVPFLMTVAVGLYMMIHSWDSLQVNMINGIGTVQLQTYIVILGSIIHIPLSLFLGKYIGALGVVCSMIVVNAIYSTCFTMQIHKILNRSASGIWLK